LRLAHGQRARASSQHITRHEIRESATMIWTIIVGIIAGWATGKIMKGSGYGVLMDLLLGIVGAFVGGWVFGVLGLNPSGGILWSILVAVVGAVLVVWLYRLVTGRRRPS
jgi:uncharacterized membrane protein YeaQ/YmgE (transglycosylase-associated protein family)